MGCIPPLHCHSRPSIISWNLRHSCLDEKHNLSIFAIRYLYLFPHASSGASEMERAAFLKWEM